MEKPILEFKPMWRVKDWGDEIIPGMGIRLKYSENDWYEKDMVLFFPAGSGAPVLAYPIQFSDTIERASIRLETEKNSRIDSYRKEFNRAKDELARLGVETKH